MEPEEGAMNTTPLLDNPTGNVGDVSSSPRPSITGAGRFLRQVSSRRPVSVGEMGAQHLGQLHRACSVYVLIVAGILWNLAFVAVAAAILVLSRDEKPSKPLRAWIIGYIVKCVVDMVLLTCSQCESIATKLLEYANTLFAFIWWIIGVCWISSGGHSLIDDAPQLYWLCVVFIALDVLTVVFRIVSALMISLGIATLLVLLSCCDNQEQDGAPQEDIEVA